MKPAKSRKAHSVGPGQQPFRFPYQPDDDATVAADAHKCLRALTCGRMRSGSEHVESNARSLANARRQPALQFLQLLGGHRSGRWARSIERGSQCAFGPVAIAIRLRRWGA